VEEAQKARTLVKEATSGMIMKKAWEITQLLAKVSCQIAKLHLVKNAIANKITNFVHTGVALLTLYLSIKELIHYSLLIHS